MLNNAKIENRLELQDWGIFLILAGKGIRIKVFSVL
jgi:hypothetical protein